MDESLLRPEERAVFALRALYRSYGYLPFKMSKFEEYELYARNKDFLLSDRVITFTDLNGRLMALKPDVTLSIVKNGEDIPGVKQKLCYDESVYRPAAGDGRYREITQTGLECIGDVDDYDLFEVVSLAVESLKAVSEDYVLELNHLGLLTALLDEVSAEEALRRQLSRCIAGKNAHELRALCRERALPETAADTLCACMAVHGELGESLTRLRTLCAGKDAALAALGALDRLYALLRQSGKAEKLAFDFSLVSDMKYYNGVVLRGFLPGAAGSVLAGGQYDRLLQRMGRKARAVGFALYLDQLEWLSPEEDACDVDLLLLYGPGLSPQTVARAVEQARAQGLSVSAQRAIPPKLRFRELRELREEALG